MNLGFLVAFISHVWITTMFNNQYTKYTPHRLEWEARYEFVSVAGSRSGARSEETSCDRS